MNLTEGALRIMINPENKDPGFKPVLQVIDILFTKSERYVLHLSDGIHKHCGAVYTERNDFVRSLRLQKGSIIQMSLFDSRVVRGVRYIFIGDFTVLVEKSHLIGEPESLMFLTNNGSILVRDSDNSSVNAVVMVEMAKREACNWQQAYEAEKKAREAEKKAREAVWQAYAAEKKTREDAELANKKLREELQVIKTHGPRFPSPLYNFFDKNC